MSRPLRRKINDIDDIIIQRSVVDKMSFLRDLTARTGREMGAIVCGSVKKNDVILSRSVTIPSSKFSVNSFWLDESKLPSIRNRSCDADQDIVAILHTHPSIDSKPSLADIIASKDLNLIGCIIGKNSVTCHLEEKIFKEINL